MSKPVDIDAYVEALPAAARPVARQLRKLIREAAPHCSETIRYGMPAFDLGAAGYLYFGVWKRHVALYPIYRGLDEDFEAAVVAHRSGEDTVRFALADPIPGCLIRLIVQRQAGQKAEP